ncbi:DUF4225 domain-containing protein [Enterobacteriaceae bacterium LUAb1]
MCHYTLSLYHLKDGFTQLAFQDEIKQFIDAQLSTIRAYPSESACQECLQNLKQERKYLSLQNDMLHSGQAVLHASVEFVKNGDLLGYIINGIGIVINGIQMVVGVGMILTFNPILSAFGAMLTLHGLNNFQESLDNFKNNSSNSVGFLKEGYMITAEFLGYDRSVGEIAYNSMDIGLSLYGAFRLTLKPDAWRLFYYLRSDYVRNFKLMTNTGLGIEIYNDTNSIKSIYETYKN